MVNLGVENFGLYKFSVFLGICQLILWPNSPLNLVPEKQLTVFLIYSGGNTN